MEVTDDLLFESRSVRNDSLNRLKIENREQAILSKIRSLFFAVWNNLSLISTEQVADFYQVPIPTINSNYQRHKDEFELDGVRLFDGFDLQVLKSLLPIGQNAKQVVAYTPAGVLRMGFILRDSEVAKSVRTFTIRFVQNVGQRMSSDRALKCLIDFNPTISALTELNKPKLSAPYAKYWHLMKPPFSKEGYPTGGIPNTSAEDIRKQIQLLASYTDYFKLQGHKEHGFKLADDFKYRYPHLTSDIFNFETDIGTSNAVIMFQFYELTVGYKDVIECVNRRYIETVKEDSKANHAYLFFVSPFGADPEAKDYVQRLLPDEYNGYVGILKVKELANFLHDIATSSITLGVLKGKVGSEFDTLRNYIEPPFPEIHKQLSFL